MPKVTSLFLGKLVNMTAVLPMRSQRLPSAIILI